MARYIDTDEFVKRVIQYPRQSTKTIGLALADTPTADVVEQSVVDQIRWERDTAIAQLAEIGKGFGETMDDVVEVVRCKDCKHFDMSDIGGTIPPIVYRCKRFARTYREAEDYCSYGEREETEDETD